MVRTYLAALAAVLAIPAPVALAQSCAAVQRAIDEMDVLFMRLASIEHALSDDTAAKEVWAALEADRCDTAKRISEAGGRVTDADCPIRLMDVQGYLTKLRPHLCADD